MHSTKKFDFYRFRKVAIMMERKDHLTAEGLMKIKSIASRMNQLNPFSEEEIDSSHEVVVIEDPLVKSE